MKKKEIFLIYKAKNDPAPQKLKLKKLSNNYYKSVEPLKLKGTSIGIDENGKTFVNVEVSGDFNIIIYFVERMDKIKLYTYDESTYSENEYKFYRQLREEEIEAIRFF